MQKISRKEEIPKEPHYAVLILNEINESDGWGGYSHRSTFDYYYTTDGEEWKEFLKSKYKEIEASRYYGAKAVFGIYASSIASLRTEVVLE